MTKQRKRQLHQAVDVIRKQSLEERLQSALQHHRGMILARVKSKSDPKIKHQIRLAADHTVYCTCQGWQFSKDKPKTCRHLEKFKANMVAQEM